MTKEEENMAIMYCPECGKEMSDSLKKCPHCGFKFKKNKETNKKKKLFVTVSIIVICCMYCRNSGIYASIEIKR